MKIALLGAAGYLGGAAAQELSGRADVGELILVDYVIRDAKRLAKALSPKCRWAMADAGKPIELSRLFEGVDAVASAVGPCAEYEKAILLCCAGMGVASASAGDGGTGRHLLFFPDRFGGYAFLRGVYFPFTISRVATFILSPRKTYNVFPTTYALVGISIPSSARSFIVGSTVPDSSPKW